MSDTKQNILALIGRLAAAETAAGRRFVAPCVRGGKVRASVEGLVQTFTPRPANYVGWGVFKPIGGGIAMVDAEATRPQITRWLKAQRTTRLILLRPLNRHAWLAYPAESSSFERRVGTVRPVAVHLVRDGTPFLRVTAGFDGAAFWFEGRDRRADPRLAEALRLAVAEYIEPAALLRKGVTPEARAAYGIVFEGMRRTAAERLAAHADRRLRTALGQGGGRLDSFVDRDDHWLVAWTDRDGDRQSSAIRKTDLTVISAGICLSGLDADFDLQSLVGVVAGAEEW